MGLFQSIGDISNKGYQKSRRRLERAQINARIADIAGQQALRKAEDPREQAQLNQSLWGRGLGKSSIAEQDKGRLSMYQANRNASLDRAMHVAVRTKQYVKKKHKHERVSMWLGIIDGIVGLAAGAGGGAAGQGGVDMDMGGMSYSGGGGGGGGDFGDWG
jgi:multidrug efflux pump subunit AcrA (membrane-fusion protein)